ncbi:hypothetical protein ACTGJ9_022850 [Bradyrhizobium sp. RDM12]
MSDVGDLLPDQPITLKTVCEEIFQGSISPATLKAEHARGNLEIFKIGRAYFTTRRHVEVMIEKCRLQARFPESRPNNNLEERARAEAARAALKLTIDKLKAARAAKRTEPNPRAIKRN